jgi:hypothetical protein
MNWTSTTVPLWQIDCENFRKVGKPFEPRDVTTEEHKRFVAAFGSKFRLKVAQKETTVVFDRTNN